VSIRNLDKMFRPQSVAVIGATDKPNSVGSALMTNLLRGGFSGPIIPVNPRAAAVHGIMAYKACKPRHAGRGHSDRRLCGRRGCPRQGA
jgi:acyl-CoA synthetase (NDP forming)